MRFQAATLKLVAFWLGLSGIVQAGQTDSPREWLDRMSSAMSHMSYQGTFVYVQGEDVVTMRITHVSDEQGVRERLVSMSGVPQEVLRDSSGVRWVSGDKRSVLEDKAFNQSFFPELPIDHRGDGDRSYTLKFGKSDRIAGQAVRNIKILPRDIYRYGYSLWLEEHTGLLLKWELIDSDRKSLANLMFTDIRLGSEVDPSELQSTSQLKKFKTVESKLPFGRTRSKGSPRWQPDRLPPGFELTAHRLFSQKGEGTYEHLVYSDGLAAISVYVDSEGHDTTREAGISRLGTTHAYSRLADNVMITVVGDVPAVTVEFIGNAVGPVTP